MRLTLDAEADAAYVYLIDDIDRDEDAHTRVAGISLETGELIGASMQTGASLRSRRRARARCSDPRRSVPQKRSPEAIAKAKPHSILGRSGRAAAGSRDRARSPLWAQRRARAEREGHMRDCRDRCRSPCSTSPAEAG